MKTDGHKRDRFTKQERLSNQKDIEGLFSNGSSIHFMPFLLKYLPTSAPQHHHSVLISVSKKKFKRAVDRNLIKRRIREAYRQNKSLISCDNLSYNMAIVYLDKQILSYREMETKLITLLTRFKKEIIDKV